MTSASASRRLVRQRLAALACALALTGCKVALYADLTEQEANEVVAALGAESVGAAKEPAGDGRWQVRVDEGRLGSALDVLRANGLPRDRYVSMGDVFQKQGLVSTPAEERMRYIHAVSQELSQTLREVDGVVAARVHVVIPANDPMSDKTRPSSAAVFVKHRPDVDMRLLAPTVKELVAHAIEGLAHEQVSLTLVEARHAAVPAPEGRVSVVPWTVDRTTWILVALGLAAAACAGMLPGLLRRQGLDWRDWLRASWRRR